MDELKKLEQGLIDKAQLQRIADDLSKAAEIKYDTAIDKAMSADPELRELWDKNQKAHAAAKAAKDDYAAAKTNAVKELLMLTDPEDMADIDAFGYRLEKKVAFSNDPTMVEQLVKMGLHSLLLPNRSLITTFIKTNAIKAGDSYELPLWLHTHWGGVVDVNTVIKPTISDAKIAKATAK